MISVQNIKKSFGNLNVLKGISFNIEQGEIVSIVGPSGAGKTTLLQIMGSLDKPDFGSIEINDTDIFSLKEKDLAKFRNNNIGFVFQFHQLLPEFSALENVSIPAFLKGLSNKDIETKALGLLKFLGLEDRVEHKPSEMSGGEQQRTAVARALINEPKVIFADEPSGNLDSETKKELHSLFFTLREKFNTSIIIVTHDEELAKMSDRVITLRDGILVEDRQNNNNNNNNNNNKSI